MSSGWDTKDRKPVIKPNDPFASLWGCHLTELSVTKLDQVLLSGKPLHVSQGWPMGVVTFVSCHFCLPCQINLPSGWTRPRTSWKMFCFNVEEPWLERKHIPTAFQMGTHRISNGFLKSERKWQESGGCLALFCTYTCCFCGVCSVGRENSLMGCLHVSFFPQMQTDMLNSPEVPRKAKAPGNLWHVSLGI